MPSAHNVGPNVITAAPIFHEVVGAILQNLGIENKLADKKPEVYAVTLMPGLQIRFFCAPAEFLNLMCFAGKLNKNFSKHAFTALLQSNLFTFEHPPISVSVDAGTSDVVLWTRLPLADATANAATALFSRFADKSSAMRAWLEQGAPAIPAFPRSAKKRRSGLAQQVLKKFNKEQQK